MNTKQAATDISKVLLTKIQRVGKGGADCIVEHLWAFLVGIHAPPRNAPSEHHLHHVSGTLPGKPPLNMPQDLDSDRQARSDHWILRVKKVEQIASSNTFGLFSLEFMHRHEMHLVSTTFIMSAELFPTSLHSTCHKISTAISKLVAIIGSFESLYIAQKPNPTKVDHSYPPDIRNSLLAGQMQSSWTTLHLSLHLHHCQARSKGVVLARRNSDAYFLDNCGNLEINLGGRVELGKAYYRALTDSVRKNFAGNGVIANMEKDNDFMFFGTNSISLGRINDDFWCTNPSILGFNGTLPSDHYGRYVMIEEEHGRKL
ncbi:hypothetical protein ZIOFF_007275 [Zingiber officinale]|uniref:Uncharacterized protein n=1 Tax=Zingiber officinale TaxID=94328 RepID=A0A8J5HQQ2_ZINOF|nr:hypothetical protein ZIOFF_007275 [Zingiber officinale]